MFVAGMLTIFLPCILPLLPIVLGVSIAGRSKWRPLFTVLGMVISFVAFTFLLLVVLSRFIELADIIRIATYQLLLLFGVCFVTESRPVRWTVAALGGLFFLLKGSTAVVLASLLGVVSVEAGGQVASGIQQFGTKVQSASRGILGVDSPINALIMGLTLGLVWAPCAGPALGFALTVVREQPGPLALAYLLAYGLGTAVPLLFVGYGGQAAVHSVRAIAKYSGRIKQIAGALLMLTALTLQLNGFTSLQIWLLERTPFGDLGTRLEESLFGSAFDDARAPAQPSSSSASQPSSSADAMQLPALPVIVRAPSEYPGLGPWHNGQPLTKADLQGKVVLVDFWTYSCINCIRTLPYIQGYWEKYKDTGKFVLLGVHSPEFVFEKSQANVAAAIRNHGLSYPIAQDNDFATWDAFANRYWPAKYLIDANGYIRYTHFGEGSYQETDLAIASLLKEAGVTLPNDVGMPQQPSVGRGSRSITPETYLGARSWPALGNSQGEPTDSTISYVSPQTLEANKFYLVGDWTLVDGEYQRLEGKSGEIRMRFTGGEINLVLAPGDQKRTVSAEVLIDGKSVKAFDVNRDDLYQLFQGEYGEHELVLKLAGPGVEAYAFTFGQ